MNQFQVSGRLCEKKPLRYTPAGVPVAEARIGHESEQLEAGLSRQVVCEIPLLALGPKAGWLDAAPLGVRVEVTGFLAARSRNSRALVLHVQEIEFLEGKENGQVLQEEG
ncbi:MAG: primosomal replication protein N [Azovibrio sp.]|uniref:primosomal replication protein N n=1 Tax=Azovibrio sp. TaxID=1872673 RepID=UPI003C784B32